MSRKLINRKTLLGMITFSARTIDSKEAAGEFPRRIVLSARSVAWDLAEVEAWIQARRQAGGKAIRPLDPLAAANASQATCSAQQQSK